MRKIFSIVLTALGALNIIFFWTPAIPTIGPQAFIVGGLLCLAGFIVWPRKGGSRIQWDRLVQASRAAATKPVEETVAIDPLLPVRALRLAQKEGGTLTVARTAMALDVPLEAANAALEECARQGNATMEVDEASGLARFEFPEFKVRRELSD